ncbi:hypothetical protein K2173_007336 [Erythroxylum novogranatense]|uniref:Uncharacterized protein n=1 Tax=Erythroxylum novogranatense TaxID=1862640 RepID=A0AAV8T663_9ROSI|nr:hypothetical protein K2173_007336 [Erythroxylum novogranatense]
MAGAKPTSTPLGTTATLKLNDGTASANSTLFEQILGALQYLTITRPDIVFVVSKLSQFMHKPTEGHLQQLKRTLRYLKHTVTHGLLLQRSSTLSLRAFSDVDWILCDNLGATYVCSNPAFHSRMKHIALDYHFVRELVQQQRLRVTHVSTHDQIADVLTKPLPKRKLDHFRDKMNVIDGTFILRGRNR